ncbi:MAG: nuclear transport factor 2 family protein [Acidimicrobiales bacterium]
MSSASERAATARTATIQLTIDYCWALDTGDWDALRTVFTNDAVTDLGAGGQRGIEEIIARVSSALGPLDDSQHMVSNHQIRLGSDGDSATGRCYLHAQHIRHGVEGSPLYVVAGRYEDRYVRTDAGWRIAERRIVTMWTDGNVEVVRPTR